MCVHTQEDCTCYLDVLPRKSTLRWILDLTGGHVECRGHELCTGGLHAKRPRVPRSEHVYSNKFPNPSRDMMARLLQQYLKLEKNVRLLEEESKTEVEEMAEVRGRGAAIVCNDTCGCPTPCPGGLACKCRSGTEDPTAGVEHKHCSCGEHCGCNPCHCTKAVGAGICKCGAGCTCVTCAA